MNHRLVPALALALVGLLAALAAALRPQPSGAPLPPALEVLERVPFELDAPATHWFRAEQPAFTSGELVVVRANGPDLTLRALATPVLYCGAETAQQLNRAESGVAVCVVPRCDDAPDGGGDLAAGPWFQGEPELPERVTRERALAELDAALARGLRPQELGAAPAPVRLADENALHLFAADLVERHAPDEVDTVRGLRGR